VREEGKTKRKEGNVETVLKRERTGGVDQGGARYISGVAMKRF